MAAAGPDHILLGTGALVAANVVRAARQKPNCDDLSDGRPRLDLNDDCNVDGLDIQLVVQQMLDGCSACN